MEGVQVTSVVAAAPETVWARIGSAEGINHELRPWLKMTVPRSLRGRTLDDVPLGVPLGRSWVLVLGLIPFDYDDLMLAERQQGRRFLETSSTLTMVRWEHERVVVAHESGCKITDTVRFEPRGLGRRSRIFRRALRSTVTVIFRHRHRRLVDYFADASKAT